MPEPTQSSENSHAAADGAAGAAERLMPLVYDELRGLAEHLMMYERADHTLQATAVVNEAYLRLIDQTEIAWEGRVHFCAIASITIRRILVDHARKHAAFKRGGEHKRVALSDEHGLSDQIGVDLIALDDALSKLGVMHERQCRVVELRFFGGLSVEETASVLEVSPRTVKVDWRAARAWLKEQLDPQ